MMRIDRRRFLQVSTGLLPLLGAMRMRAGQIGQELTTDESGHVFLASDDPGQWPGFRNSLAKWRETTKNRLGYKDDLYRSEAFAWSASNYSCCFLMTCDERFLSRDSGRYAVETFLEQGEKEFGGYDSVVLWHAYPRLGIDERNQFDFYRDLPGGLTGLREAVRRFHRRGVRVYINYNPWDTSTRREGRPDLEALADLVGALEVDGIFLDTLSQGAAAFRAKLDSTRRGVILESEGAVPLERIHDHHASWAQWFGDSYAPGVLQHKWLERRHMQHQVRRWNTDHTAELQAAWMNGSGIMVWENVFGSWMPWNQRDRSILRSMLPVQRRFTHLFAGEDWTPLVPVEQPGIFASLWQAEELRLWTLVNRTTNAIAGALLNVPAQQGHRYFDLLSGKELTAGSQARTVVLSGSIPARGIGCFASGTTRSFGKDFKHFLNGQARLKARTVFHATAATVATRLVSQSTRTAILPLQKEMVEIPAGTVDLEISMRVRECGFYESTPAAGNHLADSYRFQVRQFTRRVRFPRFAMDETLVTNAQFARFLERSRYQPAQGDNFLKHWTGRRPPPGQEDHPVRYVDLADARAYARWAGRRIPTEEEWQYAAQGTDGRKYPWGQDLEPSRCNEGQTGGPTAVRAFPQGRSPFGCYDMCGNLWQWTESERTDGRTRFCIVRGGSWFAAKGSNWYVDGGPQPTNFATKLLMICPGLDRCSTIGFRCVADLES